VMGPPVGHFASSGTWEFPPEVLATYRRDNLQLEVMFPITWGGVWDYPYPEAQELLRQLVARFGATKLCWGSDMPNVERFCTYRQTLETFTVHCGGLIGDRDIANIVGGTAARLLGLAP